MHDRLQAKIHSRSVPAGGIFAFQLMFYYGQRSKFADLLNSYHYFTISSLFCTYDLFPAPQAGHPPTPTVPSYDDLSASNFPARIHPSRSVDCAMSLTLSQGDLSYGNIGNFTVSLDMLSQIPCAALCVREIPNTFPSETAIETWIGRTRVFPSDARSFFPITAVPALSPARKMISSHSILCSVVITSPFCINIIYVSCSCCPFLFSLMIPVPIRKSPLRLPVVQNHAR